MKPKAYYFDINKKMDDTIHSVQFDKNSRFIEINFLQSSQSVDLRQHRATIRAIKPDKTEVFNDLREIDASIGRFELELTEQLNAVSGDVVAQFEIYGENESLFTTNQFTIEVSKSLSRTKTTSSDELGTLVNVLAEAQQYKNNFIKMDAKIDEEVAKTNAQLSADKKDLNAKIQEVASIGTTTEVLQATTESYIQEKLDDGTIANLTIEDNSITGIKMKEKSINVKNMNFNVVNNGVKTCNLFDKNMITKNKYVNWNTGLLYDNVNYCASDFIEFESNEIYGITHHDQIAFYSENKTFIIGLPATNSNKFTVPESAKFARFSIKLDNVDTFMISKGEVPSIYTPYGCLVGEESLTEPLKNKITNSVQTTSSRNLFNKNDVEIGKYVSPETGSLGNNANYFSSAYIEIDGCFKLSTNVYDQLAFYDENRIFVSGLSSDGINKLKTFDVPEGAKYIRVCGQLKYIDFYQLEKGDVNTEFVDYYKDRLDVNLLTPKSKNDIKSIMSEIILSIKKVKIKLIGDSITHGVGGTGFAQDGDEIIPGWHVNTNGYCWANELKKYLEQKFNVEVTNYGMIGSHSNHVLMNIDKLVAIDDDIVILTIGTNDRDSGNNGDLQRYYDNMTAIISYLKKINKRVILISNIPASLSNETSKPIHMEDINNLVYKLSNDTNTGYISLYNLFIEYCKNNKIEIDSLLEDGLHPNDNGYKVMFEILLKELGFGVKRDGAMW